MSPRMRGQGKTPHRTIRIEDDLWGQFLLATRRAGAEDRTAVIRDFIRWYVADRDEAGRPVRMPKRPGAVNGSEADMASASRVADDQ